MKKTKAILLCLITLCLMTQMLSFAAPAPEEATPEVRPLTVFLLHEDDAYVSGTGEPGSVVTLLDSYGRSVSGVIDGAGNFRIPFGPLSRGTIVTVRSNDASAYVYVQSRTKLFERPVIDPVAVGSRNLSGYSLPYAKITVIHRDSTYTTVSDASGYWFIEVPLTLPGDRFDVYQSNGSATSDGVTMQVGGEVGGELPFTVTPLKVGDYILEGTGVPGSTITIIYSKEKREVVVDHYGNWKIDIGLITSNSVFTITQSKDSLTSRSVTVRPTFSVKGTRLFGSDRIATAIECSRRFYSSCDAVILARKDVPFDALGAAPLASKLRAPILLTRANSLDSRVLSEIERLGVKRVYLLGSLNALSKRVEDALPSSLSVTRLGGSNRYETSVTIAKELIRLTGDASSYFITSGESYHDALTIGAKAAELYRPILLVKPNELPSSAKTLLLGSFKPAVEIIGGERSVSATLEQSLGRMARSVTRVKGATRYDTALAVARKYFNKAKTVFIVSGEGFSDALVAGPLGGLKHAPVLLSPNSVALNTLESYLKNLNPQTMYLLGGTGVIKPVVFERYTNN
ncbi:cell wall-binding repeat-containing protein [Guggenheimella bovis]